MKTLIALAAFAVALALFASTASTQYVVREDEPTLAEKWERYNHQDNRRNSSRQYNSSYGNRRNEDHLGNIQFPQTTQCTRYHSGQVICNTY